MLREGESESALTLRAATIETASFFQVPQEQKSLQSAETFSKMIKLETSPPPTKKAQNPTASSRPLPPTLLASPLYRATPSTYHSPREVPGEGAITHTSLP